MSRRNTDAITIHSILDWIEDNLESPLSLEKVSERSGYSKWHLQRMFKNSVQLFPWLETTLRYTDVRTKKYSSVESFSGD
ncbi:DNA-binding transcriptional activator MarA, partial [Salmonella enterica subsp. enterica serovar Enteritidis str. 13183-1]